VKRPKKPSPFDVKLSKEALQTLGGDLATEVQDAFNARLHVIGDGGLIDLADWFYEQGRSAPEDLPFPGAADLTSYFITENVDALRARLMKAVFGVRPFCFVEGWGQDAKKAPFVEEFTDWQARKSELKTELAKTIHGALIEDCYILEVSERIETRRITETIDAALELHQDTGGPIFEMGPDEKPRPKYKIDPATGDPVKAQPGEAAATIERTHTKTKRLGPQYDPISMKDFVFLPGHAKGYKQSYGYAYRFFARVPELQERADDGIYDADAVKMLGDSSDRGDTNQPVTSTDVAPQIGPAAEKELFQLSIKRDLDGDGREEWYIATLSLRTRELLRLKIDTFAQKLGRSRCVPFVLFPRRDSIYGYSYAFTKLLTLAEEHTSVRNMKADRSALATNKPIMQMQGGIWDPETQPIGVGRIITVRDKNELTEMQITDVPSSVIQSEQALHMAKERVGGLADSAVGVLSGERRTLGENKLVAGGSAVRVDEVLGHLHAAIAQVMLISNAIWVETLKAEKQGMDAPPSVVDSLASRGAELTDGKFTADQLDGEFQFEPYGSDDTADPQMRRQNFDGFAVALTKLSEKLPGVAAMLQAPEVNKAIIEQLLRSYDVRDRQPFIGAINAPPIPPQMGPGGPAPMGGPPGMPPGAGAMPPAPSGPPGAGGALPPELMQIIQSMGGVPHGA
jgi:hypothetical protein